MTDNVKVTSQDIDRAIKKIEKRQSVAGAWGFMCIIFMAIFIALPFNIFDEVCLWDYFFVIIGMVFKDFLPCALIAAFFQGISDAMDVARLKKIRDCDRLSMSAKEYYFSSRNLGMVFGILFVFSVVLAALYSCCINRLETSEAIWLSIKISVCLTASLFFWDFLIARKLMQKNTSVSVSS